MRRGLGVFGERAASGLATIHTNGTDEDEALDSDLLRDARQMEGSIAIDCAESRQRISALLAHNMRPPGQVNHAIHTCQRIAQKCTIFQGAHVINHSCRSGDFRANQAMYRETPAYQMPA
ncbi:hypothetical protein D9M69_545530 [compost metagenome]